MPYSSANDPYRSTSNSKDAPASKAAVVTPHNTNDLTVYAKALRVNAGGTLRFLPAQNDDADAITIDVVAGEIVTLCVRRVFVTGTTATGILALYD